MIKTDIDYYDIPFDKIEISQDLLDIENKTRSNLFKWNGQFSPQFIEVLLDKYCKEGFKVLDPFVGSGTVLHEAGVKGYRAVGTEINPSAYHIAKIYEWVNMDMHRRKELVANIECTLKNRFTNTEVTKDYIIENIMDIYNKEEDSDSKELITLLIVLLDFFNKLDYTVLFKRWNTLKDRVINLPYSKKSINVFNCDARNITSDDNEFDIVITSPPYINVYNYHQQYRLSMELLGYNLLHIAKSEVGSNRKHRSNRFLTVTQYCMDIALVFNELSRVCKENARIIFVVGRESNVRKVSYSNSKLVYKIAKYCNNFDLTLKQERVFQNRFGQMIYEDILHFKNNKNYKNDTEILSIAKDIAQDILKDSLNTANDDVISDIESAIFSINNVNISNMFNTITKRC